MPTASRRSRMPAPPTTVLHDADAPPVVQAAQVAFKVMAVAKADSWDGVVAAADETNARVMLTPMQQDLLDQHRAILPYLVRRGRAVTVLGCTGCDRFVFVDTKTTPTSRCTATLGCEGTPVKASTTGYRKPKALGQPDELSRGA